MVTQKRRRRLRKFSTFSSITVRKETSQNPLVIIWMTFQKLKTCCNSISSFMSLILWMENWLVSSVEEVFKSMKKMSSFYATTITFATLTTSTHCSKPSGILRVTHSSQRRGIWNDIWLLVVIVLNIFTQKIVYELRETLFGKLDAFNIPYRNELELLKNLAIFDFCPFVSRKTHTSKLRLKRRSGSMCLYQFLSRQTWSRNPFFTATPILIISSRLLSLLSKD